MGKTPFKMKGWSPFTKKSPAKHDTDPHKEHDELTGTVNDSGTRVIDESGKWVYAWKRPDLASKDQIIRAKKEGSPPGHLDKLLEENRLDEEQRLLEERENPDYPWTDPSSKE